MRHDVRELVGLALKQAGSTPVEPVSPGLEATVSTILWPLALLWPHWWLPNPWPSSCPPASVAQSRIPLTL